MAKKSKAKLSLVSNSPGVSVSEPELLTEVERKHLNAVVTLEKQANQTLLTSKEAQGALQASAAREGFMVFLSDKYNLGPQDRIELNGVILRAPPPVPPKEASE